MANHRQPHDHSKEDACVHRHMASLKRGINTGSHSRDGPVYLCPSACEECIHASKRHMAYDLVLTCRQFHVLFTPLLYADIRMVYCYGKTIEYYEHPEDWKTWDTEGDKPYYDLFRATIESNSNLLKFCRSLRIQRSVLGDFYGAVRNETLSSDLRNLRSLTLTSDVRLLFADAGKYDPVPEDTMAFLRLLPELDYLGLHRASLTLAATMLRHLKFCRHLDITFDQGFDKDLNLIRPPPKMQGQTKFHELSIDTYHLSSGPPPLRALLLWTQKLTSFHFQLGRTGDYEWGFYDSDDLGMGELWDDTQIWTFEILRDMLLPFKHSLQDLKILRLGPEDKLRLHISDFNSLRDLQISFVRPVKDSSSVAHACRQWMGPSLKHLTFDLYHVDSQGGSGPCFRSAKLDWFCGFVTHLAAIKTQQSLSIETIELKYVSHGLDNTYPPFDSELGDQSYPGELVDRHDFRNLDQARKVIQKAGLKAIVPHYEVPRWYVDVVERGWAA